MTCVKDLRWLITNFNLLFFLYIPFRDTFAKYNFFFIMAEEKRSAEEKKMQKDIVVSYRNEKEGKGCRGLLVAFFSELLHPAVSGNKSAEFRALGAKKSMPDLAYIHDGKIYGIELKMPDSNHDRNHIIEQADVMATYFFRGYFVWSKEMLWNILDAIERGQPIMSNTFQVKDYCLRNSTTKVSFEKIIKILA